MVAKLDETKVEGKKVKSEDIQGVPWPLFKLSIEELPELELKILPDRLEYSTLPVIISSKMNNNRYGHH